MPFVKGDTNINRAGRKSGVANRTTEAAKLSITRAVNGVLDTMHADLIEIKKRDPVKAMELAIKLLEYSIPKLKSIDLQGSLEVNAKIQSINLNIVDGTKHNNIKDI